MDNQVSLSAQFEPTRQEDAGKNENWLPRNTCSLKLSSRKCRLLIFFPFYLIARVDRWDNNESPFEILDITINNIAGGSHHKIINIPSKENDTSLPKVVCLLDQNNSSTEENNCKPQSDYPTYDNCVTSSNEAVRKTSDGSTASRLSCGTILIFKLL